MKKQYKNTQPYYYKTRTIMNNDDPPASTKKIVKRPDRVKPKVKERTFTVVKTTWNAFCKDATKAAFPIEKIVKNVNQVTFEAYKLANLHVLRCLENNSPLPTFDQNFFYNCLAGVSKTYSRKNMDVKEESLKEAIKDYDSMKSKDYKCGYKDNMGAYFNNVSLQMKTCFKNNFEANFYKRLVKYVKRKHVLWTKQQVYWFLTEVYDSQYKGYDPEVWKLKESMGYEKPKLFNTLHILRNILKFLQKCGEKLFTLMPNRSHFTINYVTICSSCLRDTLVSEKLTALNNKEFLERKDDFWRQLFNVSKFETTNRRFHYEVMTDGKGVSIILTKPLNATDATPVNIGHYDNVVGLDPGARDMFVASNERGEVIHCSTAEYYHDTKMYASNKKIKAWYGEDERIRSLFEDMPTMKTCIIDDVKKYLKVMFQNIHYLINFHWKKRFRDLKFTRFTMAQKKLHKLCRKIAGEGNTLVGFGDWSNNDKMIKRHPKGPVQRFKKELGRYCKVVDVDEYLSSKLCNDCKCRTKNMVRNTYNEDHEKVHRSQKVHSVLCCTNTQCERKVMNRDVNASRNMLEILKSVLMTGLRPDCFKRQGILGTPLAAPR
jgi:hypothetical protein